MGIAETGSGKTLCYALPCIVHINAQELLQKGEGPISLVLVPTRELALQIYEEVQKFAKTSCIKCLAVYGGTDKQEQLKKLQSGIEFLIATPGRLIDLLSINATNLNRVTFVVLDEADRMLDLGFEPKIKDILSKIRPDRQTLMWSATWPLEVEQLAGQYFNEPVLIKIGTERLSACTSIEQHILCINEKDKSEE